jgi:hypothetical protein
MRHLYLCVDPAFPERVEQAATAVGAIFKGPNNIPFLCLKGEFFTNLLGQRPRLDGESSLATL